MERTDEPVARRTRQLEALFAASRDVLVLLDPVGAEPRIAAANPAAERLLGAPEALLRGRPLDPAHWPATQQGLIGTLRRLLHAAPGAATVVPLDDEGGPALVEFGVTPVADGLALRGRDVTEPVVRERLLRARTAYLRHVVRQLPAAAVLCFDHELRYQVVGGEALAHLRLSAALEGLTVWDAFGPERSTPLADTYRDVLAGTAIDDEVEHGGRRFRRVATPVRTDEGTVIAGLVMLHDVTEACAAADLLREACARAEAASEAKSAFLARMSHELRTPLNAVIGFSGVLRRDATARLAPAEATLLDRIDANGRHLLALIDQILDLAKVEAGRVELALEPVRLDALVRDTLAQLEGHVGERPLRLAADLPARLAPITADPLRLRQVLINLVGNALKFTPAGEVTVAVAADPADGAPTAIEVRDTGIGIAPDRLEAIFAAFEQADAGIARAHGGTGLGLSISRALCERMGYRLGVESAPGRGSTFRITLRAA